MKINCKYAIVVSQFVALFFMGAGCSPQALMAADIDSSPVKQFSPTIYFIKLMNIESQKCEKKKPIYDVNQKVLLEVCVDSYKRCVIEGTCALVDAEEISAESEWENSHSAHDINLVNYVKLKNNVPLFEKVDTRKCPHGYGVRAICLDPFYTIAADLDFHKPGDVIFVPKAVGLLLANGERHNGYFIVRDRGGAIKGPDRFDFFTGFLDYKHSENPLTKLGFNDKNFRFEFKNVTGSAADAVRKLRRFPLTPLSQ